METWGKELLDPSTSGVAALRLEGLGVSAGETLRAGLQSPSLQVRFFAAEALAYLDDPSGADALAETAIKLPQFRAYALAALAASDQNACHIKLRHLMDQPDIEVRYGAFNALRTFDAHDPALGQARVLDEPRVEEDETISSPDAMAVALTKLANRPRVDDPFALYLVDSEGPPVVHVSRTRRSEIVLFGRGQALLPPVVLGTGAILLNAADKDDQIQISKIVPSKFGDNDVKLRTSLELGEVIRRVANLGASYPDIVSILDAANRQKNLPGTLVVDAVPTANMDYLAAAILGRDTSKKVDPAVKRTSGRRPQSRLARLLGLGNRDAVETASASRAPSQSGNPSKDAPSSHNEDKDAASPASTPANPSVANADAAPAGSNSSQYSSPKRDADLQRAGGAPNDSSSPSNSASTSPSASTSTSGRPRLLDWLFRRSD
jgi:hypothetical protein